MPFALDQPQKKKLNRVTRFAGWFLTADGQLANKILLLLNGRPHCQLMSSQRPDVAAVFPDRPYSLNSGFVGDLVLPNDYEPRDKVSIAIEIESPTDGRQTVYSSELVVEEPLRPWPGRLLNYDLNALLQDPCAAQQMQQGHDAPSKAADRWPRLIAGVPHFHPPSGLPVIRLLESGTTHPWGARARQLIADLKSDDLFLDFGAGIKAAKDLVPNGIFLDAIHFPNVDLVSTTQNIPLKSNSVGLVISQAVFEHLPNPFHSAREVLRVLKPGGKVLIDTAFMQPFHADPSHYFNMTTEGLRTIMQGFEILELGVQPHQMPSEGWIMQLETILPLLKDGAWRSRLDQLLRDLRKEGSDFDRDLGIIGQRTIAAGVFVIARKPPI